MADAITASFAAICEAVMSRQSQESQLIVRSIKLSKDGTETESELAAYRAFLDFVTTQADARTTLAKRLREILED